jgi:hypothetical protein
MGIELLAVSSQHLGSTTMMGDHPVVCLVVMSALGGLVAAGMIRERYGVAHRRRQLGLYVVKTAIVSNCGQKRKESVQAEAGAASQRYGCRPKCVDAGSGCRVGMPRFQGCCLQFHQELE